MKLDSDIPQHPEHGQKYFDRGACVLCGLEKEQPEPYHCASCYVLICPSILDYDDD